MKFYAVAVDKANKSVRIDFDVMGENAPKHRLQAEKEAIALCKKNGLTYQGVYMVKGTGKNPSTSYKFKDIRKKTGRNGKFFNQAL